jgi:hypothetical protein
MDYPTGFPARLRPRLDAEILRLRYKYQLAGDAPKRIQETIAAFVDIACKSVENGEWRVDLAHSGLKDFALDICEDHAHNMRGSWWTVEDLNQYADGLLEKVLNSREWLGYLDRLAKLGERPIQPEDSQEQPIAVQLKKLSDECRMTVEEVAEAVAVEPRSVYRHLSGEAIPRKRQLAAYERVFTEKLKRPIRLKTSGKRQ